MPIVSDHAIRRGIMMRKIERARVPWRGKIQRRVRDRLAGSGAIGTTAAAGLRRRLSSGLWMPRCPHGLLEFPKASPQLGVLGFGGSAGGGFLLRCEKVLTRRRVTQPQCARSRMERQPQHLAVQNRRSVRRRHRLQRNIPTAAQSEPLERRVQVLRLRVVQKILRHPQRFIQSVLGDPIVSSRALRRDLQHEVRRFRLTPQQVRVAILVPARPQLPRTRRAPRFSAGCPPRST